MNDSQHFSSNNVVSSHTLLKAQFLAQDFILWNPGAQKKPAVKFNS